MNYNSSEIPIVNRTYFGTADDKGRVISVVSGDLKVIKCSRSALNKILSCVDGKNSFLEIEEKMGAIYPVEGVKNYLRILLSEGIIMVKPGEDLSPTKMHILLVGSGRIYDAIKKELSYYDSFDVSNASIDDAIKLTVSNKYDVSIVAPELSTFGLFHSFNKTMLSLKCPYIPCYYNGKHMSIGPFCIPGKTACFECKTMQYIRDLNKNLPLVDRIGVKDIDNLYAAHIIPSSFDDVHLNYYARAICNEVYRWANNENLSLIDTEIKYDAEREEFVSKTNYFPTTSCACCHGMNRTYVKWGHTPICPPQTIIAESAGNICYTTGGLRSKNEEDTKKMLNGALENMGVAISVERAKSNPFDCVVPCYVATLEASHKNKTPYYFRKARTHGKGMTETQAYFSASFEMFEHISSYYLGDIPLVEAPYKAVKDLAINMDSVATSIRNYHTAYDKFSASSPIDWVWGKSLITGESKLVPASMVFMGDVELKGRFYGGTSSGLAAGASLKDAILQATFEVLEHDAWMIGQMNQVSLPFVDYSTSENEQLKERISNIKAMGYQVVCRDYTNDIGLPVFRTWIMNPRNFTHFAYSGFGASISPEIALERSFTEAMQGDAVVNPNNPMNSNFSGKQLFKWVNSLYCLPYFYKKDILGDAPIHSISDMPKAEMKTVDNALQKTLDLIQLRLPSADILYVDLTKDGINIPAVRVIITGDIQHLNIPPVSVSPRTLNFCINMGYASKPAEYQELYLGDYPH